MPAVWATSSLDVHCHCSERNSPSRWLSLLSDLPVCIYVMLASYRVPDKLYVFIVKLPATFGRDYPYMHSVYRPSNFDFPIVKAFPRLLFNDFHYSGFLTPEICKSNPIWA